MIRKNILDKITDGNGQGRHNQKLIAPGHFNDHEQGGNGNPPCSAEYRRHADNNKGSRGQMKNRCQRPAKHGPHIKTGRKDTARSTGRNRERHGDYFGQWQDTQQPQAEFPINCQLNPTISPAKNLRQYQGKETK